MTLERDIQQSIRLTLGRETDLELMVNVVGLFDDGRGTKRRVGLGIGTPDLVGILAPLGRWFALEIKSSDGKLRPEQVVAIDRWRRRGAFVAVVRSPDEARAALDRARNGANE